MSIKITINRLSRSILLLLHQLTGSPVAGGKGVVMTFCCLQPVRALPLYLSLPLYLLLMPVLALALVRTLI